MKKIIPGFALILGALIPMQSGSAGNPDEGQRLFLTYCSACHGTTGKGDGEGSKYLETRPQDLTDQSVMTKLSDQDIFNSIRGNKKELHGARFLQGSQLDLTDEQTWDLVSFIKNLYTKSVGDPIEGRKLYLTYCSTCHGRNGEGDGEAAEFLETKPRNHADDKRMSKRTDLELYNTISGGGEAAHMAKSMPPWSTLSAKQVWDLVAFIRILHRQHNLVGVASRAAEDFSHYCSVCHGHEGRGNGAIATAFDPRPKNFADPKYSAAHSRLDIYFAIMGGGEAVGQSQFMPPWAKVLSDQEIWDLVSYIQSIPSK